MGEWYQEVVVNCLTSLDEDNVDLGDGGEFEGADGVAVGVGYIKKVRIPTTDSHANSGQICSDFR